MKNKNNLYFSFMLVFLLNISSAWAACVPEDVNGRWNVYLNNEDGWTICHLFVSVGQIVDSNCTHSNGSKYAFGGNSLFTMNSNCVAKTQIFLFSVVTTGLSEFKNLNLVHMTFSRDKLSFSGVGRGNLGGNFTFTGVKL